MNSPAQGHFRLESNDTIVSRLAQEDKVPWYSKPNLRLLYILMLPACLSVDMATGFDASMVNGLQAVPSWIEYFHHPRATLLGLIVAVYPLGYVAAVPLIPSIVDKTGRRYPILLAGVVSIIGGIMQGSALNVTMFIISRFILGSASVLGLVAASSLIAELSYPNERATISSLFPAFFNLGSVAASAVILTTFAMTNDWGWRIPSFLQAAFSLFQITFIWFLPESPRWLVSQGRGDEAYAILVKYHAEGDEDSEFAKAEYAQIVDALEAEQKVSEMNWKKAFSPPGMRKRACVTIFLALSAHWSGIGLIIYFLVPILDNIGIHDNRTKNLISLARTSWSCVSSAVSAFIAPRYPRRSVFLVCTISLFVVIVAWTVASAEYSLTQNDVFAQVVLILMFLYTPAFNLGFSILIYRIDEIYIAYLAELFPFHVRARGLSLYQWFARMAGFVILIMNPIGIEAAGWKWYLVYCAWNAFQVVFVYLMLPETSGRTLEELRFLYESERVSTSTRSEVETLRQRGRAETQYGAMEDTSRRTDH